MALAMSVEQAALALGVSRSSAYAAVRRGELPVVRLRRRLLVPIVALEHLLASATVGHERGEELGRLDVAGREEVGVDVQRR